MTASGLALIVYDMELASEFIMLVTFVPFCVLARCAVPTKVNPPIRMTAKNALKRVFFTVNPCLILLVSVDKRVFVKVS